MTRCFALMREMVPEGAFDEEATAKIKKVMKNSNIVTPNVTISWNLSQEIDNFDVQMIILGLTNQIEYPEVYVARWKAGLSDLKDTVYNITGYIEGAEYTIF